MAARRLILVMLVLLVLSSAVAAIVPVQRGDEATPSTSTTTTAVSKPPAGDLVTAEIRADGKRPERIRAREGDQLRLRISSSRPGDAEIVALGVFENVDPLMPATVDLLLVERGTYPVRFLPPSAAADADRVIGRIVVSAARGESTHRTGGGGS